jgi:hypothetical protein
LNPTLQFPQARVNKALAADMINITPIPIIAFVSTMSFPLPLLFVPLEGVEPPPLDCGGLLLLVGIPDGVKVAAGFETQALAAAMADVLERGLTVPFPANKQDWLLRLVIS